MPDAKLFCFFDKNSYFKSSYFGYRHKTFMIQIYCFS